MCSNTTATMETEMKRKLLTQAVCLALAVSCMPAVALAQDAAIAAPQQQQDTGDQDRNDDAKNLDTVVVTGSRIPRAVQETAAPTFSITAEDIQKQGFRNVSDVLRAQPLATGAVQDNQSGGSGSFTAEATTISLLGLDPSFTLILMDGRPLADFPLLYNGQSNFTDLSSIPVAMIERIDILPGNQSSIYGSAAIAGVVNIILKKYLEGVQLDLRAGGYTEGGGGNERLQLTGGNRFGDFDLTWGLQYSHQNPIYLRQRDYTDSTSDNPNPALRYGSRIAIILDGFTGQYNDPGTGCDALSHLYGGTVGIDFRPGRGNFCGSREQPAFISILNEEQGTSAYLSGNFALTDNADLYATLLMSKNKVTVDTGSRFWYPHYNNGLQGYVWNSAENTLETYQRIFAPEEQGRDGGFYDSNSDSYSAAFGIKGVFGESDWNYEAYYSRSGFKVTSDQWWPLVDAMDQFFRDQFMGPQLGTYYGYPVYEPNKPALYQAITPEQFRSFSDVIHNVSRTWTQNFNAQVVNPNLFQLPAGPVGVAAVVQVGNQFWDNPVDPRVSGDAFFGINGTSGQGKRENQAVGVEFAVPIFEKLSANLSTRYDRYKNVGGGSDAKATYKIGLEYRPIDTLLLRGNYGTAFRAPDMGYVFSGGNGFFSNSETDFYKCEIDPVNCNLYTGVSVEGNQVGNLELKSINAKSFGYGFVWSPNRNFDLHVDYYNVQLSDKVVPLTISRILFDENECRQGRMDINSARCVDAISRVERTPVNPNAPQLSQNVSRVTVSPINIADERVSGLTAGANFRAEGRHGRFNAGLEYNLTHAHQYQTFPEDPVTDAFADGQALTAEFKSIITGDVGWEIGRFGVNVHGIRYGSLPNYARQFSATTNGVAPGRIRPWMLYNTTFDFKVSERSRLSLIVNNVLNSRPPSDPSWDGSQGFAPPYYNVFAYNGYGRSYWLEYKIDFGKKL